MSASNADWSWAAGFFEGEGSIVVPANGAQPVLYLVSTDLDVLERFGCVVGAGNINPQAMRDCHTKQQYRWSSGARLDVDYILRKMLPWLGERRSLRAIEALDRIAQKEGNPPFSVEALKR